MDTKQHSFTVSLVAFLPEPWNGDPGDKSSDPLATTRDAAVGTPSAEARWAMSVMTGEAALMAWMMRCIGHHDGDPRAPTYYGAYVELTLTDDESKEVVRHARIDATERLNKEGIAGLQATIMDLYESSKGIAAGAQGMHVMLTGDVRQHGDSITVAREREEQVKA